MPATYSLSDVLIQEMRPVAKAINVSEEMFVAMAVAEKIARVEYLLWRSAQSRDSVKAERQECSNLSEHKSES